MNLRPEQIDEAKFLRNECGLSFAIIADRFGCSKYTVQTALDPGKRAVYRMRQKARRLAARKYNLRGDDEPLLQIPESVRANWLARAREYAARTDTTAILCGDPLSDVCALYNRERR